MRFPLDPDYDFQANRENTQYTGIFREKFFFLVFVNSVSINVFVVPDTEFDPIRVFKINARIPNFNGICWRYIFLFIFVNSVLIVTVRKNRRLKIKKIKKN